MSKRRSQILREMMASEVDDLKQINGISPAVETRLHGVGIYTFARLAAMSPADLAAPIADLSGLRAELIVKQDWIGQARVLAARQKNDVKFPSEIPHSPTSAGKQRKDENVSLDVRHHATFTVELQLNEDNIVLEVHIVHRESGEESIWDGLQTTHLVDFMMQHGGKSSLQQQPAPVTIQQVDAAKIPINGLKLGDLEVVIAGNSDQRSLLQAEQPFSVRLLLDLSDVVISEENAFNYTATIYAKSMGGSNRLTLAEGHGDISSGDEASVSLECTPPPCGTYRLEAAVRLEPATTMPRSHPAVTSPTMLKKRGGIIYIY